MTPEYRQMMDAIINGDKPTPALTPEARKHWNGFIDYLDAKKLRGSPQLDARDTKLSKNLFEEYNKSVGAHEKYEEFVPAVQQAISDYRTKAIEQIKNGKAALDGYKPGEPFDFDKNFMSGLSTVDGWAGSRTTSYKFPSENIPVIDPAKQQVVAVKPNDMYAQQQKIGIAPEIFDK